YACDEQLDTATGERGGCAEETPDEHTQRNDLRARGAVGEHTQRNARDDVDQEESSSQRAVLEVAEVEFGLQTWTDGGGYQAVEVIDHIDREHQPEDGARGADQARTWLEDARHPAARGGRLRRPLILDQLLRSHDAGLFLSCVDNRPVLSRLWLNRQGESARS